MARNTSVSLGVHFERFIDDRLKTGRFGNASEIVRAGLVARRRGFDRLKLAGY